MFQLVLIVLLSVITTSGGSDVVLGVLGNTAFIECQVPISKTLIWLSENGNIIAMNGKVTNENSTKYLIETQNGLRESLVIHDLTLADDSVFKCYDINNKSYVDSTKLSVLAKPPMMNATVSPPQPMLEGTEVTLICEADGGKPLPEIKWYRKSADGNVTEVIGNVTDTTYANGTGHRVNKLTTNVTRGMYQTTFMCNITVSLLYQETFTIDTDVLLAPSKPEISSKGYDGSFDENSVLNLECSSNGGNTAPNIYWLINGNRVGDVEVVVKPHKNGTSTVIAYFHKKMSRVYNGSVLTCAVTNKVLLDQGLPPRVANIDLLASYLPKVTIEQNEYVTRTGENVTINCLIDGNPLPRFDQMYWTHKGAMIDRKYYSLSNGSDTFSLNLQDVKISDAGYYTCHAVSRLGAGSSSQTQLTVLYAPACEFTSVKKVAVRMGENAALNCRMMASPNDVTFTWRYKQHDERIKRTHGIPDMRSGDLVNGALDLFVGSQIRYGEIECSGNNTEGESDEPCLFDIVPPGPPEIPVNCSTTVNDTDIQVNCKAGFNGGSTQHFILQKLGKFEYETFLTADNPNFRFQSYENVTIRICTFNDDFKNIQHCAIPSEIVVFVQGLPEDEPVKGGKSHETAYIAGGVVAAIGVIVIAIIISALLFRRYKKGKTSRNINDLESVSENKDIKSNKLEKWWKAVSIKQFSAYFRKAESNKSTPASVQQREAVTDIDDNDTPNQDFVRISSTPYHPFKAYRIERNLNCSLFNERIEQTIKDDRHIAPDVLNESTGFALSPIISRNIDAKISYQPECSISYLDDVIETHTAEENRNETTDDGVSNCYRTADMIDILSETDSKHDLKEVDNEAVNTLFVETLDKDYTDGDFVSVLDRSDDSVLNFESQLQFKDETNEGELTSECDKCDDTSFKSSDKMFDSDLSVSVLKFMNVDFSVVSTGVEDASKINNISEESIARNSNTSFSKCSVLSSPTPEMSTENYITNPSRLAKAYSLPYRSRKQRQNNIHKANSLSDFDRKNEVPVINTPSGEYLQKWNRSTNSHSSENFSSDRTSYITAIDIDNEISDNHASISSRSISSRTTNASDTICDIDEFTLTVNSDTTTDFDSKEGFESLYSDKQDTTYNTSRLESLASNTSFDIDKYTLTLTSESELDSTYIVDNQRDPKHDSTDVSQRLHDSFRSCDRSSPRSPKREMLRRNSFLEAISNTLEDNKEETSISKETNDSVIIDSETEGSYYNYGYEIETDSKLSEGETIKTDDESSEGVNVVAYF